MMIFQIEHTLHFFGEIVMTNLNTNENVIVHHKVKDYNAWRKAYDGHEKSRAAAGITKGKVFRSAEDPNDVVLVMDVADVAKVRTWMASADLKTAMEKGGVIGTPTIRYAA
jgi:hypothetical protein